MKRQAVGLFLERLYGREKPLKADARNWRRTILDQRSTQERENKIEGSVLGHSGGFKDYLTIVLAKALNEWMARNPGRSVDEMNLSAVLPEAVDEFIWRHLDDSE